MENKQNLEELAKIVGQLRKTSPFLYDIVPGMDTFAPPCLDTQPNFDSVRNIICSLRDNLKRNNIPGENPAYPLLNKLSRYLNNTENTWKSYQWNSRTWSCSVYEKPLEEYFQTRRKLLKQIKEIVGNKK